MSPPRIKEHDFQRYYLRLDEIAKRRAARQTHEGSGLDADQQAAYEFCVVTFEYLMTAGARLQIQNLAGNLAAAFLDLGAGNVPPLFKRRDQKVGAPQPTVAQIIFQAWAVRASNALIAVAGGRGVQKADQRVANTCRWINDNPEMKVRLGGAPSAAAVRNWRLKVMKGDEPLATFYRGIAVAEAEDGSPDAAEWYLEQLSSGTGLAFLKQ
jgi:hypothetical protein